MRPGELESYLHEHIPLSAAMEVRVEAIEADGVTLAAPLAPNINHRDTVFGGSASALAILAAWSLVHVRLREAGLQSRIVIQRNSVEYTAPIPGAFTARSRLTDAGDWDRFARMLVRRGRARVGVSALLESEGAQCASFEGTFVAIVTSR